jgi:hypothetical protein
VTASRLRAPGGRLGRSTRLLCFLGASGLAIAGIVGAGSADAGGPAATPAPPAYTFSTAATAIGVQVAFQQDPELSSLPDPFDVRTPESDANLDSFGTSQADGHVANLNGLGGIPGLICLIAGASACNAIPIGTLTAGLIPSFPPPDPLDAHATYPQAQTASAPVVGTKAAQASFASSGFSLAAAAANSQAHQYDTSTQAVDQNLGIAGVLSVGSATTVTTQTATASGVTTTATANLSNIALGGTLVTIGAMKSTTTVVSTPGKRGTDKTTTELADVKAAGVPATIDSSGIHVDGKALPLNLVSLVQKLVNQILGKAGIKLSLAQAKSSNSDTGHTVAASSLLLTFDHTLSGVKPIAIAPPTGLPCPPQLAALPLDPCSGISLSLDGHYHGQVALGQVGVVSLAQPSGATSSVPPPVGTTPPVGTSPGGAGISSGPGPVTIPPTGPTSTTGPSTGGTAPVVAGNPKQVADQLKGASRRLEWFFPLLALGLLALVGRFRTPSRFPSTGSNS